MRNLILLTVAGLLTAPQLTPEIYSRRLRRGQESPAEQGGLPHGNGVQLIAV